MKNFFKRIPFDRINWVTSIFLTSTFLISLTAVPYYIWKHGLNMFQISLFFTFYIATGLSITLGYHRLFSHLSFKAKWPVKLFVLLFGAASFENAALDWCSDHRRHHKHVDGNLDPYDISMGFWFAHIGWLLFKLKPETPMDNVNDLRKDSLVMWQYKWITLLSIMLGLVFPTFLGILFDGSSGAIGGFLIGGIARIVAVQQSTFCINSLCHTFGNRPYSSKCSARDSWFAALITFGEGYHNYHHEFQHDYRNGVKYWQFDPTKWIIWVLSKIQLTTNLRRVASNKILITEIKETQKKIIFNLENLNIELPKWKIKLPESTYNFVKLYHKKLKNKLENFKTSANRLQTKTDNKINISKEVVSEWHKEINEVMEVLELLTLESAFLSKF